MGAFSAVDPPAIEGHALKADAAFSQPEGWKDELWAMVVGSLDSVLRTCYGIEEFTNDPLCVLRLGESTARMTVVLGGGVDVRAGDPVGTLHLWNEHLPRYRSAGPDVRWAVDMRRRMQHSLRELAHFVEDDPEWRDIRAFRAETALSSRLGIVQLDRVAARYGFECVFEPISWTRHLHAIGDCFNAWGLTRVYNPTALARQRFFRSYNDLWITRSTLLDRYGRWRQGA